MSSKRLSKPKDVLVSKPKDVLVCRFSFKMSYCTFAVLHTSSMIVIHCCNSYALS